MGGQAARLYLLVFEAGTRLETLPAASQMVYLAGLLVADLAGIARPAAAHPAQVAGGP